MDECERVLDRLSRIEALERESAPVEALLMEVRALLGEAEAWVRSEARGAARAQTAVDALRAALDRPQETVLPPERTLVA